MLRCAQSAHQDWSNGVMEWWSDEFETQYSNIPLFQHSILCSRLASEIFLISLPRVFPHAVREFVNANEESDRATDIKSADEPFSPAY
jgi:hypothetical protein